ncbi:MAG TPA: fructosamine kinase family protein, partial [Roseiflexaceae bacterium]|nr:fructosamine kinase family protein [Roseiflexaceae bacterium]
MDSIIAEALRLAGDSTPLRAQAAVGGGSISQATRLRTDRGEYLLKAGGPGLPGFFAAEARGLGLLAATGAVWVPAVLAYRDSASPHVEHSNVQTARPELACPELVEWVEGFERSNVDMGFILLEWLAAPAHADRASAAEALGAQLAALHCATATAYGLDHDNYIGATPQPNGWMAGWSSFFR